MKLLFMMMMMIFSILMILIIILNFISKKSFMDREKSSPFECGFDPKNSSRLPFSLHFFLIATIFLIFDVEITLMLPSILSFKLSNMANIYIFNFIFMTILIIGTIHEWMQGALNWLN